MGKKKSKAEAQPIMLPEQRAAIAEAFGTLTGLKEQFPTEWFEEYVAGALPGYMNMLQQLGEKGLYDPEAMRGVWQQAMAPMLQLQQRGLRDMLMGQVAAGKARAPTALESLAKQGGAAYAKSWENIPNLMAEQAKAQMTGLQGLKTGLQTMLAPQTYQKDIAGTMLGGAAGIPTGTETKTEQPRSYLWGLFG